MRKVIRTVVLLGLVALAVNLTGCSSCKDYLLQIDQLNAQVADLQKDVADREAVIKEREQIAEELKGSLKDCQTENAVLVEQAEEVVMITIPDQLGFASGQVMVLDTMVPTLEAIAATVRQHPDWDVYVEGYTDNKKISEEYQEYWPTNWELGAARAASVVRYMTNQLDLPAERFAAVSYGPFRPVADNDTPEGRAKNRMVRVLLHKPEK